MALDQTTNTKQGRSNWPETPLKDIVNFLQDSWTKLALAGLVGALLGLVGWITLGNYTALYALNNGYNSVPSLDLVSWKMLQKSLPNLVSQIIDQKKVPESQERLFSEMADEIWWQKNVSISYAFSKSDAKELAVIGKDWDAASTAIINFSFTSKSSRKDQALREVIGAANLFRTGGAYLQIRSLLHGIESQTLGTIPDVQNKITSTKIEMAYLRARAQNLDELNKRFPAGINVGQQLFDPKESGAKYLPISTQIIAVNNEINQSKENLDRLQKKIEQTILARDFLSQATHVENKYFDGLILADQLLQIESDIRSKLSKDDLNGQLFLDQLRLQLTEIKTRFANGLQADTSPTVAKKGLVRAMAEGLFGALFLIFLALLIQRIWLSAYATVLNEKYGHD